MFFLVNKDEDFLTNSKSRTIHSYMNHLEDGDYRTLFPEQ